MAAAAVKPSAADGGGAAPLPPQMLVSPTADAPPYVAALIRGEGLRGRSWGGCLSAGLLSRRALQATSRMTGVRLRALAGGT
jgi:hypothetical protein